MNRLYFFFAFLSGLVFGLGLLIAGMANPKKILAFLDVAGAWDPSLALVMVAAIVIGAIGFGIAKTRTRSLLGGPMQLPGARQLDRRLIFGSLVFGVGWGIAGFCPGPALVAAALGYGKALLFVLAMTIGMLIYEVIEKLRTRT